MKFIIFLLVLLAPYAEAEFPYETCTWQNKAFTDRMLIDTEEDTEAGYCWDCDDVLFNEGDSDYGPVHNLLAFHDISGKNIPAACFLAANIRGTEKLPIRKPGPNKVSGKIESKGYFYCSTQEKGSRILMQTVDDSGEGRQIYTRPPCIHQEYVQTVADSFNKMTECFGFSPTDKKYLFALLNRESSFFANAKSDTGARCFSQLTRDAMIDINKIIVRSLKRNDKGWRNESVGSVYTQAQKKCPQLQALIPDDLKKVSETIRKEEFNDQRPISFNRIPNGCFVSQNPNKCLFYSLIFIRNQHNTTLAKVKDTPDYMGTRESSKKYRKDFKLPTKIDELIVLKGPLTKKVNNKPRDYSFVFWDTVEVHEQMPRFNYDLNELEVQKVSLFRKEDAQKIAWALTSTAHNGGNSLIQDHLTDFYKQIKLSISATACHTKKQKKKKACIYRAKIQRGESLNFEDFSKELRAYLKRNYNVAQAPGFLPAIKEDMHNVSALSTKNEDGKINRSKLRVSIDNFFKKEGDSITSAEKDTLERNINAKCHWPDLY